MSLPFEELKKRIKSFNTYEECLELYEEKKQFLSSNAPIEQKNYIASLGESLYMCIMAYENIMKKDKNNGIR